MAKWLWIGAGVVLLAIGTAGYVLNSGAPAPPKGVCPALLSAAPFDANIVAYADLTSMRSADLTKQFKTFEQTPQAAAYRDFVANTNFHIDRDLDHILLAASTEGQNGALVLEGRFDQPRVSSYVASLGGTMKHYDAGDLYEFQVRSAPTTTSMMFLGPNRLAFALGRDAHTEMLMLADAAKEADPNLHADICARVERVAGAPFFLLGDVPKAAVAQMTPGGCPPKPQRCRHFAELAGLGHGLLDGWRQREDSRGGAIRQFLRRAALALRLRKDARIDSEGSRPGENRSRSSESRGTDRRRHDGESRDLDRRALRPHGDRAEEVRPAGACRVGYCRTPLSGRRIPLKLTVQT